MQKTNGYIKEKDAVSISYDGSVGQTVVISGLKIILPKAPPKTRMWKRSDKKEQQYFERQLPPRGLKRETEDKYEDYIDEQYKYKREGFWFLNNGKPEYITGAHWFLLQWCRSQAEKTKIYPKGEYFFFSKAQQKVFYMLEAAWLDHRSYGAILIKIRRFGLTGVALAFSLSKSITKRNGLFGLTSKTDNDAKSAFTRMAYMFKGLPFFFEPHNLGVTKSDIVYNVPEKRVTQKNKHVDREDGLNTIVNYKATNEDAYDGEALTFYIADESSKYATGKSIIKHWEIVRKALTKGVKKTGKAFLFSTIENYNGVKSPETDKNSGSGDKFMAIYDQSDPSKRNENGETESGLYKMFISCYEHYEGMMDMYGYPIVHDDDKGVETVEGNIVYNGIKSIIQNEVESLKDNPYKLYSRLRKTPREEEDVRRTVDINGVFDTKNIIAQIEHNNSLPSDKRPMQGRLIWEIPYQTVKFSPSENGDFLVSWIPKNPNHVVKGRGGLLFPNNDNLCIGVDPYKVTQTVDGRGSSGAIHGFAGANICGAPQNEFFFEYIANPKTKELFFEEIMKACIFWGCMTLIERDVPEAIETMHKNGLGNFCMLNPFKERKNLTVDEKLGGISLRGNITVSHTGALDTYIAEHVGYADNDKWREIGKIGNMPFNRTLQDWAVFDPSNRTKYDASISSGIALLGAQKHKIVKRENSSMSGIIKFYEAGNKRII